MTPKEEKNKAIREGNWWTEEELGNDAIQKAQQMRKAKINFSGDNYLQPPLQKVAAKMSLKQKVQATFQVTAGKKPTVHYENRKHHVRMAKYHEGEVKHHQSRLDYISKMISEHPERPTWNADYEKPKQKHEAFVKYHSMMAERHHKKCKNC